MASQKADQHKRCYIYIYILVMPYEALVNLITEESPRYLGVVDLELIIQAWNGTDENNYMGLNCKLFLIGRDQDD